MRGLAVTGAQRSPLAPELPTVSEAGLARLSARSVVGPGRSGANAAGPVVKRLNDELNAVLALPEMQEVLAREGADAAAGTPEDFGKLIASDFVRWSKLIKDAHIQVE